MMCGIDDDTTCLHHIRTGSNAGMGQKPHDRDGVTLCDKCHGYVHNDGRSDWKAQLQAYQRQVEHYFRNGIWLESPPQKRPQG
jgi:hypothetical protein